ncbi:AbiH family protein [Apilactobacillus kunkeei]|uniref:AbiH family protein n=1 Tax=Apilactobacillus kunkeei TaxID=148814 RepID=UPI0039E0196C
MVNKLLIIGNGFDLHLHLKSSFKDFFDYLFKKNYPDICSNDDLNISTDNSIKQTYEQFDRISDLTDRNYEKEYIDKITDWILKNIFPNDYGLSEKLFPNPINNFWIYYFKYLSLFPNFDDLNDEFNNKSSNFNLKNWSDVEHQIQFILENTEDLFQNINYLNKKVESYGYSGEDIKHKQAIEQNYLFDFLSTKNKITFSDAINFNVLFISIMTGWELSKGSIYDFLFNELIEFENIFKDYLKKNIPINYKEEALSLAKELTKVEKFNVLNFNYTKFYDDNDVTKNNIHSTLDDSSHPIFGISSIGKNNEKNYSKPYYKFTKTYRIMSLSKENSIRNFLPNDIDEIVFYGHSISKSDYLYFEVIINKYINELNNSNIIFSFKYSNYESDGIVQNMEQVQINLIYNLFNTIGEQRNINSLLQKLVLNQNIKIQELK